MGGRATRHPGGTDSVAGLEGLRVWGLPADAPALGSSATADGDLSAGPEVDYPYLPRAAGVQSEEGATGEAPQGELVEEPRRASGRDAAGWEAALALEPTSERERALEPLEEGSVSGEPSEPVDPGGAERAESDGLAPSSQAAALPEADGREERSFEPRGTAAHARGRRPTAAG